MGNGIKTATEKNNILAFAVHAAATATEERGLFAAPCKARVRGVRITSDIAVTGDNTNTTNLAVIHKGAVGVGTTQVMALALPTAVNLVAFDEKDVPPVAAYVLGVDMAAGDTLTFQFTKVGTGVAIGPGLITIDWEPL